MADTKPHVPVLTLSTQGITKLLGELNSGVPENH